MIIEIFWTCECGEGNSTSWDIGNDNINDDCTYYCYCSECGEEFPATNENSQIEEVLK